MLRFYFPDPSLPFREQKETLISQFDRFLKSDILRDLFLLLGVDQQTFAEAYNSRQTTGGAVRELQELEPYASLEEYRGELYQILYELGMFSINRPRYSEYSHIIVLGGSLNACYVRTQCAAIWVDRSTRFVDGLTCYRPINPVERKNTALSSVSDTEYGAMRDSFSKVFDLSPLDGGEEFLSDRNLNGISCIKTFSCTRDEPTYRIWAAPSTQPELRRADTGDCLLFYLERAEVEPKSTLLAITHNRHCNRQFVQLAYRLIKEEFPVCPDVIGCLSDNELTTMEEYDPLLYLQELIGLLDWIERFKLEL